MIEDDLKVRQEILRYLRELDVEGVEEFPTAREFERHYFAELVKKPETKKTSHTPLEGLSPDLIKVIQAATFAKEAAIQDGTTEIEIDATTGQILRVNLAKIFGRTVTEMVAKNISLDALLVDECKPILKVALAAIKTGSKKNQVLAFQNDKKEIWVAEMGGRATDKTFVLNIADRTKEVAKSLGKDAETKEKAPVEEKKSSVDLIIFRVDPSQVKELPKWVTKTATLLKKTNRWPAENRPKFIALRYEDDPHEKFEYNHPFIDDLLSLPLDRMIFLQKVEIVLALPKKASPSFLFIQEADEKIEIAKRANLERICDQGFAMSNPFPLAPGTPGHFYFRFPGQKPLLDMYGKVMFSSQHPEQEGEFLVYFAFFGLTKTNNRELRQYLQRDTGHKAFVDNDSKHFEYNSDNIFLSDEEKRKKTLAVLDPDESSARSLFDYARKEIGNVDVVWDDSYYSFFKTYIDLKARQEKSVPATPQDLYGEMVSFLVGEDMNLQMPLTPPGENDQILGRPATAVFGTPQGWLELFGGDTRNQLTEIMYVVRSSKRTTKNMDLMSSDGLKRTVAAEFIYEDTSHLVRVNLRAPEQRGAVGTKNQVQALQSLETIIIDYTLLPENIPSFVAGLKDALKAANIACPPDGPKLIVIANESQNADIAKLLAEPSVSAFLYKPVEIRRLLFLTSLLLENPHSIYKFDNIPWKTDKIIAKIAREATITEISEFGCTVLSNQPLKPGSMFYLFKSIYNNAPDQNLCVRIYHSQENESEKGTYLNSALYFGITDAFLKFTRSYIRETYASKKSKEVS